MWLRTSGASARNSRRPAREASASGEAQQARRCAGAASRRRSGTRRNRGRPARNGRPGHEQHVGQQCAGHQVERFAAVRRSDVRRHAGVDHDAVADHVVLRHRRRQHDGEPERLHPAAPGRERQQRRRQRGQDDGDDRCRQHAARAGVDAGQLAPERQVADHRRPGRDDDDGRDRRARPRPALAGSLEPRQRRARTARLPCEGSAATAFVVEIMALTLSSGPDGALNPGLRNGSGFAERRH